MGFWGRLFGTESALASVVEGVRNGLDALVYTDQERAEDAAEARKMIIQWVANSQGQNLARRLIALSITGVWLFMYLLSVICEIVAVFGPSSAIAVGEIAKGAAADMNPAVMLILAFYFAAPHMGEIAKALKR